ncbi:hypothetical protein Tco_0327215 [Tanacetum coccineum]
MNTRLNIEKLDGNIVQKHGSSKQGSQGDREAEVFQVSNDDTVVAQRWLDDKQPEEKTNTDCLVKELEKEYHNGWKIKTFGLSKVFWAEDTTMSTHLVNSIKQGMLEPVKVKCIFLGYRKGIVGNKLWRLDDVTSKVVLYRNMGFNESGKYNKTFIGSGVGTGSVQVLQGVEFEEVQTQDFIYYHSTRDREQHSAWELFSYREDSNEAAFVVATVEKIYAHESLTFNDTVTCEVISKWKAGLKEDMDAWSDVCKAGIWATKGLLDKAKGNVHGMKIVRDKSGNTLRVSQSRFYNGKLNGKWSCINAVGSQEYQMVYTILDIASANVGMLNKFDRGLQTDIQLEHIEALSTTKAGYMTFTEAWKKEIWLKGPLTELRYELRLVATGSLVKGCSRSEVPAHVKVVTYRY